MHPSVLAKRKAHAIGRLVERSTLIGRYLQFDEELMNSLRVSHPRDPEVEDMLRLEGLANFLARMAEYLAFDPEEKVEHEIGEFSVSAPVEPPSGTLTTSQGTVEIEPVTEEEEESPSEQEKQEEQEEEEDIQITSHSDEKPKAIRARRKTSKK